MQPESHIHVSLARRCSLRQAVALAALGYFAVLLLGFHLSYWLVAMPFGVVSMALAFTHQLSATEIALMPFSSLSEIRAVFRRSPKFRKRHYPETLARRKIRSDFETTFLTVPSYIMWLLASPFVLLFQALPKTHTELFAAAHG